MRITDSLNNNDDDDDAVTTDTSPVGILSTWLCCVSESHSEASDQELEWEEQQIRKGVNIPAQPVSSLLLLLSRNLVICLSS